MKKQRLNVRWFSYLTTLIVALGLLTGCGETATSNVTTAAASQTTNAIQTTIQQTTIAQTTTLAAVTTSVAASTAAPAQEATTVAATIPPGDFQNPVLVNDFADPFVFVFNGTFYGYATNANSKNVQVATSSDMINWTLAGDALPALPKWAKLGGSLVWAPDVKQVSSKFVMYYTARDKTSNKQCIGVATSDKPDGKFKDSSEQPIVCQPDEGGDIDPDVFQDSNNKLYLYFKNDGNCCQMPTNLYAQELAPDGLSLIGQPTKLMSNDVPWEGRVVEGPQMFKHDNNYYLFFSANDYAGVDYAVGYATCKTAVGPCQQADNNPILKSALKKPPVIGPGGESLLQVGDQTWIFYHAWEVTIAGTKTDRRLMWLDKVDWKDGKPTVQGPTTDPQPLPKIK